MRSTNPRDVAYMFRDYIRKMHAKAVPNDPNFLRISVMCGKIEQWCEHHYPSFVSIVQGAGGVGQHQLNLTDARTRVVLLEQKHDAELKAHELAQKGNGKGAVNGNGVHATEGIPWEMLMYIGGAFVIVMAFSLAAAYGMLWVFGDA